MPRRWPGQRTRLRPCRFTTRTLSVPPLHSGVASMKLLRWRSDVLCCARRVKCTFILAKQKQKVTVPGMVGWTLLDTAKHHNLPVNGIAADTPWDYYTFGEGPASVEDHVVVAQEFWEACLPVGYQEQDLLEKEERFKQPMCAVASTPTPVAGGRVSCPTPTTPTEVNLALALALALPLQVLGSPNTYNGRAANSPRGQGQGRGKGYRPLTMLPNYLPL